MTTKPGRNNDLAQIHIAKKALAMSDDSYRGLLVRITGKDSTQHMSLTERSNILVEFKRLGWSQKPKRQHKQYAQPLSRKLIMQWRDLYESGHVTNKSNAALEAWIKGETGKSNPDWLDKAEANRLVEALKAWGKRRVKEAGE